MLKLQPMLPTHSFPMILFYHLTVNLLITNTLCFRGLYRIDIHRFAKFLENNFQFCFLPMPWTDIHFVANFSQYHWKQCLSGMLGADFRNDSKKCV